MALRATEDILVVISPHGGLSRDYAGRDGFWRFVTRFKTSQQAADYGPDDFERAIEQNLGRALREQLARHIGGSWFSRTRDGVVTRWGLGDVADPLAVLYSRISFRARIAGYNTLDLVIEVAGVGSLMKLLGSAGVFELFLAAYLPDAFDGAFEGDYSPSRGLDFNLNLSPGFVQAFSEDRLNTDMPTGGRLARAGEIGRRRLWLLTNGTLLIPFTLALGVLYVAHEDLASRRRELADLQRALLAHQDVLVKSMMERQDLGKRVEEILLRRFVDEGVSKAQTGMEGRPFK